MDRTNKEQREAAEAWASWEFLRRGVILGQVPPMKQKDIVECCGYEQYTTSKWEARAIQNSKCISDV